MFFSYNRLVIANERRDGRPLSGVGPDSLQDAAVQGGVEIETNYEFIINN